MKTRLFTAWVVISECSPAGALERGQHAVRSVHLSAGGRALLPAFSESFTWLWEGAFSSSSKQPHGLLRKCKPGASPRQLPDWEETFLAYTVSPFSCFSPPCHPHVTPM